MDKIFIQDVFQEFSIFLPQLHAMYNTVSSATLIFISFYNKNQMNH